MADIALAMRLVWVMAGPFDEEVVYGVNTGIRNGGDWDDLLDAMQNWWTTDLGSGLKNRVTLTGLRLLDWNTAQGRFVQVATRSVSFAGGSVATLPPQCAAVATWRYSDVNVPQRQRYNRCYLGYLSAASVESTDGRLTTTARAGINSDMVELHNRLELIPASDPILEGLCVTSVAGQAINAATEVGAGLVVDTQRRRRADYPEGIAYSALP